MRAELRMTGRKATTTPTGRVMPELPNRSASRRRRAAPGRAPPGRQAGRRRAAHRRGAAAPWPPGCGQPRRPRPCRGWRSTRSPLPGRCATARSGQPARSQPVEHAVHPPSFLALAVHERVRRVPASSLTRPVFGAVNTVAPWRIAGESPNRSMPISMRTAPTANDVRCRQSPTPDSSGCDESAPSLRPRSCPLLGPSRGRPSHLTTPRRPARTAHHAGEHVTCSWVIGGRGLYVSREDNLHGPLHHRR